MKQDDLTGARLVDCNGEQERGGHGKHAIRLDDGYVGGAEVADVESEGGGQALLLRGLPHQAPRAVAGPPGRVLAAVALRGLRGTVGEADEGAERAGVIELLRGERRMGHGEISLRMRRRAREPLSSGSAVTGSLPHLSLCGLHGRECAAPRD
jgi:hypothetical protein